MKLKYTLLFAAGLLAGGLQAATLTVLNTNDNLAGSLRQAIQDAAPGDKIVFNIPTGAPGYDPATGTFTITLMSGHLAIAKNLTIDGTGERVIIARSSAQGTPRTTVVFVSAGVVQLINLNITGGNAFDSPDANGGGVINSATLTLRNCSIYSNQTIGFGGGVYNSGSLTVSNCTIGNNSSASVGGGIYNAGSLTVTATTITANSTFNGIAIYTTGPAHVGNSVLLNTTEAPNAYTCVQGAFISSGYNFISYLDGSTGFGGSGSHDQFGTTQVPGDAKLGALADNGGWTKSMMPLNGSPLIDQGNSSGLTTDQRDRRRPIDNPAIVNVGDSSDIGAVETDFPQTGPTFTVNTTDEHSDQLCGVQDCSLWDAANAAGAYSASTGQSATVKFASNVRGTITTALQADGIEISQPVNYVGPGASALTISGAGVSRVFNIASGTTNVNISGLTIANGAFSDYGGGVHNDGDLTLTNCVVSANQAVGGFYGGGISNKGSLTLTNVSLAGNSATAGAGIYNTGACIAVNVTFSANHATPGSGGGAYNSGSLHLTNCTLSGNSSDYQGGGIGNAGSVTLTNVTLSGNSASFNGGISSPSAPITIANTIIAKGASGQNCGGFSGGSSNLSDDNTCGFTTPGDPLQRDNVTDLKLGPLANNGGFTQTHLPQSGSRAIDHGTTVAGLKTDQRGVKRPQGLAFDVGAVEAGVTLIENGSYFIQYDGWGGIKNASANGGTYRISKTTNDTVTYKFTNTSIKWITAKGPNMGKALVTIDGALAGTIDLYSPSVLWNQQIPFSGLTNAAHSIVIKVTGTKNANATGFNVAIDGFLVGSSTTPVQENSVAVTYNGWTGTNQSAASGGSYRSNGTLGSVARFKFTGTAISFVTARGPSYGMVNVLIDGVTKSSNLDLYATSAQWKYGVSYSGFTNANHTIEIRPTHTKNSSSTGYNVVVDAFSGPFTALP